MRAEYRVLAILNRVHHGERKTRLGALITTGILLGLAGQASPESPSTKEEAALAMARRRTPAVEVVERAGPAVVNIATEIVSKGNPFSRGRRRDDDFFFEFFGRRQKRQQRQQSLGSGVIIDPKGLVLTNEHVISRATNITITLSDRRTYEVDVIGADPEFDLAVLKVRGAQGNLPSVSLGTSGDLMPGEPVVAIGNPFGLSNSVTTGVVSALHRSIGAGGDRIYEDFVQTDAAINPGNSGGALLNINGRLIGINTAIYKSGTGIGFAIPIDKAKAVVDEVLRYGEVRPVFSGIVIDPQSEPGALVLEVQGGSPAEAAGLSARDRIVDVSGQEVRTGLSFRKIERGLVPGQTVDLTVERASTKGTSTRKKVQVKVRELTRERALEIGRARLGVAVKLRGKRMVITKVTRGSDAARIGVRRGDSLLAIGGIRMEGPEDFEAVCASIYDAQAVTAVIQRGGRAYYVTLELQDSV